MDICAVCQDDLVSDRKKLHCGHTFHHRCLTPINKKDGRRSCPLCRALFSLVTITYLDGERKMIHELESEEYVYCDKKWLYIMKGGEVIIRGLQIKSYMDISSSFNEDTPIDLAGLTKPVIIPKVYPRKLN